MEIHWLELQISIPYVIPAGWFIIAWGFFYATSLLMLKVYKRKEWQYQERLKEEGVVSEYAQNKKSRHIVLLALAPIVFLFMFYVFVEQNRRHKRDTASVLKKRAIGSNW